MPMADLRELFESLGFESVVTYIQSGNVVFDTDLDEESIVGQVTEAFGVRFGFDTSLILRTAQEMEEIATRPSPLDI